MTKEIPELTLEEQQVLARLEQRIFGLKEQNRLMIQEISVAGAAVDVSQARLESFVNFLVENGALTNAQRLVEQEQWELKLRVQLKPIIDQIRQAATANGQDVRTGSGIILPGKR